jgi:hypothetical protein
MLELVVAALHFVPILKNQNISRYISLLWTDFCGPGHALTDLSIVRLDK